MPSVPTSTCPKAGLGSAVDPAVPNVLSTAPSTVSRVTACALVWSPVISTARPEESTAPRDGVVP